MNNELIKTYFEVKIKTLDELIKDEKEEEHRDWLMMRESIFKSIYEEFKALSGGEL